MSIPSLSAIEIAACIYRGIEYTKKIVVYSEEIEKDGTTVDVAHIKEVIEDLRSLRGGLRAKPPLGDALYSNALAQEDLSLDSLLSSTTKIMDELSQCLESITLNKLNKNKKWHSVSKAILTIWKKDKIDHLVKRLDTYNDAVSRRVLFLINLKADAYHADLAGRSNSAHDQIVELLAFSKEDTAIRKQDTEKILEAIYRLESGILTTVSADSDSSRTNARMSGPAVATAFSLPGIESIWSTTSSTSRDDNLVSNLSKIVNRLWFPQIVDRFEEVALAHRKTFEWAFEDPTRLQRPWSNLVQWLRTGTGRYWICGKAGSGKSTLMKFIYQDSRTRTALLEWAGTCQLEIVSFFFWNFGTDLQKTQEGMLRSILFTVLDKHRHLIPIVLPSLYRAAAADKNRVELQPSLTELRSAFKNLLKLQDSKVRIFVLIDGVDEYEGDFGKLAEMLSSVEISSSVKVLLSSRPTLACESAFGKCPSLKLEDLTDSDIRRYVKDRLGGNTLMQRLIEQEGNEATQLITEITEKASGVFLWVILVTQSLLDGLDGGDRCDDLRRRLGELPASLSELYRTMLPENSTERYQASKMLQIMLRSTEVQAQNPLTLLQMSCAEDADLDKALNTVTQTLSEYEIEYMCSTMERRLKSRCHGLIEVWTPSRGSLAKQCKSYKYVAFLHKTVAEFVRSDEAGRIIFDWTKDTNFDVDYSLLTACLYEAKYLRFKPPWDESATIINLVYGFEYLHSLDRAGMISAAMQTKLLDNFHQVVQDKMIQDTQEVNAAESKESSQWIHRLAHRQNWLGWERWKAWSKQQRCSDFAVLAVTYNCVPYMIMELSKMTNRNLVNTGRNIFLIYLLDFCLEVKVVSLTNLVLLIQELITFEGFWASFTGESITVAMPMSERNVWMFCLAYFNNKLITEDLYGETRHVMLLWIMLHLAKTGRYEVNVSLTGKDGSNSSALEIIENKMMPVEIHYEGAKPQRKRRPYSPYDQLLEIIQKATVAQKASVEPPDPAEVAKSPLIVEHKKVSVEKNEKNTAQASWRWKILCCF